MRQRITMRNRHKQRNTGTSITLVPTGTGHCIHHPPQPLPLDAFIAMADAHRSAQLKDEGNTFFAQKDYKTAIQKYTEAIALDGTNAVLYCNSRALGQKCCTTAAVTAHFPACLAADNGRTTLDESTTDVREGGSSPWKQVDIYSIGSNKMARGASR
ncbi:hypothetical protein OF83DRAFT_1148766 [Amylostereum chailletii]|nr:hypothetical protein OF83DRAFT_1148766 [Amylostereum chailletii]